MPNGERQEDEAHHFCITSCTTPDILTQTMSGVLIMNLMRMTKLFSTFTSKTHVHPHSRINPVRASALSLGNVEYKKGGKFPFIPQLNIPSASGFSYTFLSFVYGCRKSRTNARRNSSHPLPTPSHSCPYVLTQLFLQFTNLLGDTRGGSQLHGRNLWDRQ